MTPSNRGSQPKNGARQPRQSSGKLPAHVYRRRRYMLLVASLVVIALLVLGVVGIVSGLNGGGEEEPVAEDTSSASPSTTQVPVPDEKAASGKCPENKVGLKAKVDEKSFDEDAKPKFEMVVENNHTATCLIEVGTEKQEFLVEKNGDVVWSSKFCAAEEDENAEVSTEFAPKSEKTSQFEWNRVRVDKNCNRTNEDFGPGEYELVVKLGDKKSKPAKFTLEKDATAKEKEKKEAEEKKSDEPNSDEKPEESSTPDD
ncbi:hypothetical protein [Brevibacterium picturae]|uniref:Uncharacterized protein n=1 Tax=Brevibacterium picturae TaxID=260553 RepID=A0ABP4M1Q0_9MICO